MLQKLNSIDDMSKEQQDKYLNKLKSIKDIDYVVEVLVKELARTDYKKGQLISVFLQELGDLETLQETLWSYIKSPKSSDELKDLSGIILKSLGDTTDPEEFLSYLDNPKAIVDKETQKLLEIASVNPEAQIDFLDFMFSLPETEQINLIVSLKDDYSSEYLINIAVPALESTTSTEMEEVLIKILGETRSPLAVSPLNGVLKYSNNEIIKKQAQKSLNMLKIAGVDVDLINNSSPVAPIAKISDIYECHTNIVDGIGNQGFIISRIKPNQDILMMNIVVNDVHGILDCFGFYGISKEDFSRIIQKFQEMTTRFFVTPEYCKRKLLEAEKINKENNLPIPYEYAAWKSLMSDISPLKTDFEALGKKWASKDLINETSILYKFPDFKHWFFEEDDHSQINEFLEESIKEVLDKDEYFIKNNDQLKIWFDSKTDKFTEKIFDEETKNIYKNRLLDISYLLDFEGLNFFRDVTSSLAWCISSAENCEIKKVPFFRELARRTIMESLIRYQHKIETEAEDFKGASVIKKQQPVHNSAPVSKMKDINKIISILSDFS